MTRVRVLPEQGDSSSMGHQQKFRRQHTLRASGDSTLDLTARGTSTIDPKPLVSEI